MGVCYTLYGCFKGIYIILSYVNPLYFDVLDIHIEIFMINSEV